MCSLRSVLAVRFEFKTSTECLGMSPILSRTCREEGALSRGNGEGVVISRVRKEPDDMARKV